MTAFADKYTRELDRIAILVEKKCRDVSFRQVRRCLYTTNLASDYWPFAKSQRCLTLLGGSGSIRGLSLLPAMYTIGQHSKRKVESPNILAKLSSKVCFTPEIMKRRYFDSKLLNVLFACTIHAFRIRPSLSSFNSVNPGFCISNLRSTLPEGYKEVNTEQEAELAFTKEEGSRQLCLVLSEEQTTETSIEGRTYHSRKSLKKATCDQRVWKGRTGQGLDEMLKASTPKLRIWLAST